MNHLYSEAAVAVAPCSITYKIIAAMEPQSSAIDRALAELNLLIMKIQNDSSSPLNESKPTPEAKQTTQVISDLLQGAL